MLTSSLLRRRRRNETIFLLSLAPSGSDGNDQDDNRNNGDSNTDGADGDGANNRPNGEGNENRPSGDGDQSGAGKVDGDGTTEGTSETSSPAKRGMNWLPVIIIAASIGALLLFGLIFLLIRKKRASKGYAPPPNANEQTARA